MKHEKKRDSWGSKWGFILACIRLRGRHGQHLALSGSGVKIRRSHLPDPLSDLCGYHRLHRRHRGDGLRPGHRSGPVHAFGEATKLRFGTDKPGKLLGLIPVLGSLALAIGYSVVTGWIFKYTAQSITGALSALDGVDAFSANFGATASGNLGWQIAGMAGHHRHHGLRRGPGHREGQ